MTPQRQIPQTLGELMAGVLHANEMQAANVEANAKAVAKLTVALEHVAVGLERRPTKRQTIRWGSILTVGAVVANVLAVGLMWFSLHSCIDPDGSCAKRGQERGQSLVRGLQCFDAYTHGLDADQLYPECPDVRAAMAGAGLPVP